MSTRSSSNYVASKKGEKMTLSHYSACVSRTVRRRRKKKFPLKNLITEEKKSRFNSIPAEAVIGVPLLHRVNCNGVSTAVPLLHRQAFIRYLRLQISCPSLSSLSWSSICRALPLPRSEMEIDSNSVENPLLNESEEVEEPKKGMCFTSKQEAYTFYAKYAKHVGFSIACKTQVIGDDGELRYFGIECSRSGKRIKKSEVNPLKPSLSTKIDCKARVRASLQKDGRFMLTTVNLEHNHDLIPTDSRHFAMNKKILSPVKRRLEINDQAGIGVSRNYNSMVVEAGGYESLTFDERDARNYIERARKLRLGEGDSDALQKYFLRMHAQNSSFYYMIDVDTDFRIRNLFWADAMSRAAYEEFGDVVSFDTTYLTNKYDMPFAPFVGVNHHGQSILLGCGLLSSEDTDTFVWLFKSWLNCMSDHPPKAIITDQCKAMQKAIEIVFPNARHRWCLWHIMKKIPEKLKGYSQYESMKMDLQNAVYDTFTKDEFEMKWKEMIAKFNLYENQWLGVLYDERHRWVPVYVKDIFWAGMSTTQRSESMNAFFDGYVNPKTTLKQFVEQYDNALRSKVEKEKKADFKSRHKVFDCLTVYGFEKQFQDAYTNAKFKEVQAEMKRLVYCQPFLVKEEGSICTYFVKEAVVVFGKMKHVDFVVYYNSTEFDVQCMCRLFEFRGIMCAHSFVVLIARCINEVPNKYILPRWRKNLDRGYTCIKTTYTGFGDDFNAKVYDKMNRKLIGIIQFAGNSEGKIKLIDRGLDEIKAKVMKDDEGGGSNVAPSTSNVPPITSNVPSSPIGGINRKAISHTKLLSPLVARRKGRPVTKRKVAKVDQIVNRLKASKRKHNKSKGTKVIEGEGEGQCQSQSQSQPERGARRELYPCMIGMENSMCVPGHMVNAIGGTSLTPASVDIMRGQSFMNAPTQIYGVGTSLTPSNCIGGTPGFITTQQSMIATHQIYGAVPSSFVDLNVHMDRNDHGGSFR